MEAILFYGDQDEATRRQVRSVAAQYSHRIGPRKRKKSKLSKHDGPETKRGHYKKLTNVSDVSASSSTSQQYHQSHHSSDTTGWRYPDFQTRPDATAAAALEAHQRSQREYLLRREVSGSSTCLSSSEVGSDPAYSPHTPQMEFGRTTPASVSPNKPQSIYRRLPAYTWTEYPRYAVNQTGSTSPSQTPTSGGIDARRPVIELPDPTAFAAAGPGLQNAPRSHPMDMPPRPHHHSPPVETKSACADPMPSHSISQPISSDGRARSKEETADGQLSAPPPPLQISRCATDVQPPEDRNDDSSRWRSGTGEDRIPSSPPG